MSLSMRWTKHLKTKGAKEDFEQRIKGAQEFFDIMKALIEEDLNALEKEIESKDNYFMPAWAEYQADRIGSKRTLKKILNLIP